MLDRVAHVCGALGHYVAGALLLGIMALTVTNIFVRGIGLGSIAGNVELVEMAMVLIVYMSLAHAERHGDHVAVELAYRHLPRGVQRVVLTFARLLAIAAVTFLAWRLVVHAGVLEGGGYTTGVLRLPMAPVAWLGAVGAALLAVAVLANLVRQFVPDE